MKTIVLENIMNYAMITKTQLYHYYHNVRDNKPYIT